MYKLCLFFLLVSTSYAQSVNFQEILDFTLKNNKDLKQQKYNIKSSKLDIKSVEANSYGKLSISHELSRTNHSGYVFNSKLSSREASFKDFGFSQMNEGLNTQPQDLNYPKSRTNHTTKLSYDLPLFTGFKLSNQKKILQLQKKANELRYNLNEKELSYEVLKAYNGAVVTKEYIKALQKAKKTIDFLGKSALAFHKEGFVTKIDVKQAKVHKLNINSKLLETQNNFHLAIAYLKFLSSNENIKDVKELKNIDYDVKYNQTKFYETALENRDELKMQNIHKKAMKKSIDLEKSSYYPNVYSHLEYGFNDDKVTFDDEKDYYLAMLGVSYTIFDNTRKSKTQKSKIAYKKASLDYEKLKDAIKLEVEQAVLNLNSKNKILKEKFEAKELSNEVLEQSKLMYKNHLISMSDLLKQESDLQKNEAEFINAKYEKSLAQARLFLTLGKNFMKEIN